jgi:hypothetical protein
MIAIFTERFFDILNNPNMQFQQISRHWERGTVIFGADEIKDLLKKKAPLKLYVEYDPKSDQGASTPIVKQEGTHAHKSTKGRSS